MNKSEMYDLYENDPKGFEAHLEKEGYKMLGWQAHSGNTPEIKACLDKGHFGHQGKELTRVAEIQHTRSGSDVTYWCRDCKTYWKIDMSG